MAVWRFVNLDIKEAQLLADLTGVLRDLEATEAICDSLLGELQKLGESQKSLWDLRMLEALSAAALVRYARSFGSGVRAQTPESVFKGLSEGQAADHKWFMDLRDKYIAHSVNAFEENQVVAYLMPEERGPRGVSSISVQERRLASLGHDDVGRLKALCTEFRSRISQIVEEEREKVLKCARTLPVDKLYAQVDPPPKAAFGSDVGKPRKRL